MEELLEQLKTLCGSNQAEKRIDGYWLESPRLHVLACGEWMASHQFRLSTMTAVERADGETDVIYHYAKGKTAINIRTTTEQQKLPSLAHLLPSAGWIEREIRDLYAVHFEGHPDPRPLVRPKEMPEGFFRKSVADSIMKESEAK